MFVVPLQEYKSYSLLDALLGPTTVYPAGTGNDGSDCAYGCTPGAPTLHRAGYEVDPTGGGALDDELEGAEEVVDADVLVTGADVEPDVVGGGVLDEGGELVVDDEDEAGLDADVEV